MPLGPEGLTTGRSHLDLVKAQLDAIDAWHRARHADESVAESESLTREMRLDQSRRTDAYRREQQALISRADAQLTDSGGTLSGTAPTRAVLAHRSAWLREGVARRLEARGVAVVGLFEDGADVAGTAVVEQPDLVLVEDRLPTLSGIEVVRRIRTFSPRTVVGAQCLDAVGIQALTDAGAQAVFARRVPPVEIADQLLEHLTRGSPVAVG